MTAPRPPSPAVTVATVVARDGRLLMVEERADGRVVLNQPAGHLEPGESLQEAAIRETREETGWDVRLTGFLGAYLWDLPRPGPDRAAAYLRFAFAAEPVAHDASRPLDAGILRALWLAPDALRAERDRHRSPLVWRTASDFLSGRLQPLDLVQRLA